jgi:hypothetical protein
MRVRRVVVALGTADSAAMTTAVDLAHSLEAELLGLFVEDVELFNLAALPFAGEVGFPSAVRRTLDVGAMERSLRAQAQRLQRELSARLAGRPVKWTFEVVRGRAVAELRAAVEARDLVIVSMPRTAAGKARARADAVRAFEGLSAPLLLTSEATRGSVSMRVVASARAAPDEIADAIVTLAPYYGRAVLVVLVDTHPPHLEAWQRELRSRLAAHGIDARFRVVTDPGPAVLDRLLAEERPSLVVALARDTVSRDALLEALPCPLLVLPEQAS